MGSLPLLGGGGGAAAGTNLDGYFTNTKLLMGFNGADASTGSPGMTDESGAARGTATAHNQAQIDTAQSVFGGSSLLCDGTTDWISFSDSADFNLSNRLFTLECRIRTTTVSGTHFIIGQWANAPTLGWVFNQNGTQLQLNLSTTGSDNLADLTAAGVLAINTWYAVCVDFDGTKYRLYVNGSMAGSSTTLRTINNSSLDLSIGGGAAGAFSWNGWIDELRLTMDVARYASDSGYTVLSQEFPRT